MLGLNIPYASEYLVMTAGILLLFKWLGNVSKNSARFLASFSLLLSFLITYYTAVYLHNIAGFNEALRNIFTITSSYALGYSVNKENTPGWPQGLSIPLIGITAGFLIFSVLCVHTFLQNADITQIMERVAVNYWDGSVLNSPGLGANASLSMCMLSIILFSRKNQKLGILTTSTRLSVAAMFLAGVYVNAVLMNRTPFIATAISLFFCAVFFFYFPDANWKSALIKLTLGVTGTFAAIIFAVTSVDSNQVTIFTRFSEEGLSSSGRFTAWKSLVTSLPESLLGGRVVRLGEDLSFVHNLWLDVIWDAGIVPFLFLSAFHLAHLRCFKIVLQTKDSLVTPLIVIGMGTSFFINFMQEPTLSASVPYFAGSCFFLGLLLRLTVDLNKEKEEIYINIAPSDKS